MRLASLSGEPPPVDSDLRRELRERLAVHHLPYPVIPAQAGIHKALVTQKGRKRGVYGSPPARG